MTVLTAIETVLSEAGTSLNYNEITKRILQRGLLTSRGKTPERTVNANLATEIKKNGPNSRFQRTGKGLFALRVLSTSDGKVPVSSVAPALAPALKNFQPSAPKTLSFADAAERVLEQFGSKTPMHYIAITEKALSLGLVSTAGQTPAATLYAQVLTEIARNSKRGEAPRFVKLGRGLVGLSKWIPNGLAHEIEQHNSNVRKELHARLISMPPVDFQNLISNVLLPALGFNQLTVTSFSGDGGIDVRATLVVGDVISTRMAVQVKRWTKNVQAPVVQQVRGSLGTHEQGLIITTSDFSTGARTEAQRPNAVPVALMTGEQLVILLVEHDIGVDRVSYDLIELANADDEALT